jgi:hypothetical protein
MYILNHVLLHHQIPQNGIINSVWLCTLGKNPTETHKMLQLVWVGLCPEHQHFDGLRVLMRADRMWMMTHAVDD